MNKVFYQAVQGIWNPREGKFSYVVCEEFDTYKEAKKWAARESKSGDPTLAILEVRSKVLWRARPVEAEPEDAEQQAPRGESVE